MLLGLSLYITKHGRAYYRVMGMVRMEKGRAT